MIANYYNLEYDSFAPKLTYLFIYCTFCQISRLNFIETIVWSLIYLIFESVYISFQPENFQIFFISIALVLWQLCIKHMQLRMELDLFNKDRVLDYEKTRLNQLVRNL